ncbi:hypothetical protein Tco_0621613 [Tanacetum coccineum]
MSNRHQELTSPEQTAHAMASPEQTATGKDFSNPFIAGSLLKTIWLSLHHVFLMKQWLVQSKRLLETDIQEKEQKESQKQTNPSMEWKGQSQKSSQVKKIQLEGLKLPNLKLYYKR